MAVQYKDFKVGEIFRLVNPKGKLTTKQLISGTDIAYVAAKKTNNGVAMMCSRENIPDEQIMPGNCIVFVQQGDGSAGYTTYQPNDFYAISCVCCGYIDGILNENIGMYLVSVLDKNKAFYSHSNSWSGEKLFNTKMPLPVKADGTPDWNDMQERIAELEQERIAELEQERIAELEQYLAATGLNDYELTDEDREVLSLSGFWCDEKSDSKAATGVRKEMREFRMGDLFDIHPTVAYKLTNMALYETAGNVPVLSNSSSNNGIAGFSGLAPTEQGNIITFSDTTTGADTMFYQSNPFIGYPHVQGIYPHDYNFFTEEIAHYFIGVIRSACGDGWSYANKFTRTFVLGVSILLPICTDAANNPIIDSAKTYHPDGYVPDWDFMSRYIRAIEKIVIKDVVKYKNEMIQKTKEIVGVV